MMFVRLFFKNVETPIEVRLHPEKLRNENNLADLLHGAGREKANNTKLIDSDGAERTIVVSELRMVTVRS